MSDNLDPRNRPASEEPLDPAILSAMSDARHFGYQWSGAEPAAVLLHDGSYSVCSCDLARCGLIAKISTECERHDISKLAAAKQSHWAKECPGMRGA